jgi:hypothetical protein
MTAEAFRNWREEVFRSGEISPARIGMSREEVLTAFGEPSRTSSKKKGKPLILKYGDLEFHFGDLDGDRLLRIYSDDENGSIRLCIPPV